jgi:hypothetical protein
MGFPPGGQIHLNEQIEIAVRSLLEQERHRQALMAVNTDLTVHVYIFQTGGTWSMRKVGVKK